MHAHMCEPIKYMISSSQTAAIGLDYTKNERIDHTLCHNYMMEIQQMWEMCKLV